MKIRLMLAVLAGLLPALSAQAQGSHLQISYDKTNDRTIVRSDLLYVINSPTQFLEIQLVGRYRGSGKPKQAPDKLYIELSSFSPDPLYQEDAKHRLKAKAGDQVIDFGLLSYSRIDEAGKDPKDSSNPKPLKSNFQFRVKLPEAALLWGTARTHLLTLETMTVSEVQVPDLQALSSADNVVMKLGDNVFRITPVQASIVREFTNSITPLDGAAPVVRVDNSTAVPADVPSDRNNASLANTLEWLQTHLERDASTKDIVVARKAEPISFKSCHIAYRVAPLVRNSPVSATLVYAIFEYQIDLADLNSEAVRVSDQRDFSMVEMTTRDNKPRIKVFKHANDGGITGRTLEDGLSESAVINLKNHDAALQFKTALTHAINLCQPKP